MNIPRNGNILYVNVYIYIYVLKHILASSIYMLDHLKMGYLEDLR